MRARSDRASVQRVMIDRRSIGRERNSRSSTSVNDARDVRMRSPSRRSRSRSNPSYVALRALVLHPPLPRADTVCIA